MTEVTLNNIGESFDHIRSAEITMHVQLERAHGNISAAVGDPANIQYAIPTAIKALETLGHDYRLLGEEILKAQAVLKDWGKQNGI